MDDLKKKELLVTELLPHRERLLIFILSKESDPVLAEDILQESLLKALNGLPDLEDEQKILSWFYKIVRNNIIDHYRRSNTDSKYFEKCIREASFYETEEGKKRSANALKIFCLP